MDTFLFSNTGSAKANRIYNPITQVMAMLTKSAQ